MFDSFDPTKYQVALLAGGKSGEREISLSSGEGAKEALETAGFQVTQIDPAQKKDLRKLIDGEFDVAFLCLHGKYGEDGTVQGFLETIELPYTCSGVWSSALAIDKGKSKIFYEKEEIKTPPSILVSSLNDFDSADAGDLCECTCVVKPGTEGSALGVYIVTGEEAVREALENVLKIDTSAMIERYIKGREFTVAVLGNENPEVLPVIEIIPKSDFYNFESKYSPGGSQHICPAVVPLETEVQLKDMAKRAHIALSCEGVSRSDFIVDEAGVCWILETNTIPGMTQTSLLPDAAKAAGVSFSELCTKLIKLALKRV